MAKRLTPINSIPVTDAQGRVYTMNIYPTSIRLDLTQPLEGEEIECSIQYNRSKYSRDKTSAWVCIQTADTICQFQVDDDQTARKSLDMVNRYLEGTLPENIKPRITDR